MAVLGLPPEDTANRRCNLRLIRIRRCPRMQRCHTHSLFERRWRRARLWPRRCRARKIVYKVDRKSDQPDRGHRTAWHWRGSPSLIL